jgi:uncharacterized protein (UPF0210 family)
MNSSSMKNMKPTDRLAFLVTTMLEPAMAGGLSRDEAKAIYNTMMEHYSVMQAIRSDFAQALITELQKAIFAVGGTMQN